MSSIKHPIIKGQKRVIFHRFLTQISPSNHYMLWPNLLICPLNHNCSLAIIIFQTTPLNPRYLRQNFNRVFPFSPLFSFLILKFIILQGKTLLKFEYSFSFSVSSFQYFFQYFKYLSFFYCSFSFLILFYFSILFFFYFLSFNNYTGLIY